MGTHPLDDTCPLCDKPLGRHNPRTNPLRKWRDRWAHLDCIYREKGE